MFSFILNTAEACDPEDTSTSDEHAASCTVRDPTSEHVYNLAPLKKKSGVYEVSAAQHTFKVNKGVAGLILGLHPANERRRYKVTPSPIGWAQT